ncbi:SDR family NAD(P)-dependent oxidoreductase [Candidatus Calescamantes bacterium]|nr:SDR family NAD(P)-dependent oxidoreductase [Candidatus Calescamantes bacterium]
MILKGKRILVTGGAGFIGSHLVDLLLKEGAKVRVVDDFSSGKRENLSHHKGNDNLEIIKGDIRNRSLLKDVLSNVDWVYHLAVRCLRESLKDPFVVHEVNATATLELCELCRKMEIKKFVYVSSSEVYGSAEYVPMDENHPLNPTTVYGASKLAGEKYALAYFYTYGLPVTVIRPFNTYGPREHFEGVYGEVIPRFIIQILNNQSPTIFGDGKQTRDFTYVEDIARGILEVSLHPDSVGKIFNIARGEEVSIIDVANLLIHLLKKEGISPVFLSPRPGDVKRHFASVSRAREIAGFEAKINFEEGIEKFLAWFREVYSNPKHLLPLIEKFCWEGR